MAKAVVNDGVVCELLFNDMDTSREVVFFLAEDERWYRIDPPDRVHKWAGLSRTPVNWRPTKRKLTPGRRAEVVIVANKSDW